MEGKKGQKFNFQQISIKNDYTKPYAETFNKNSSSQIKFCICGNYNELKGFQCFKCKNKIHYCVKVQINRPQTHSFQCLSCLARAMDLVYQPQNILLETFYRIESIFQKPNIITFQFDLKFEDMKYPVDVRGFKGNKIELAWPMQGQFYLNGGKNSIFALKPLKSNTNRKNRKQQNFMIEPNFLKQGRNILTFKIPKLQKTKTIEKYKYEETGVYFLGIYSVKQLKNQQVLNITQRQRRFQKFQTLELFKQGDEDIPTEKQKVRLIDPYTGQRIKFPVRGRYCTHLATVCLVSYVGFQKHSRSWKCPICSVQSNSFMNEPYLDVWMHQILKQNGKGQNVFIHPNGTYEWQAIKQIAEIIDSEDDQQIVQSRANNRKQISQQQPIITELQNFDLQSHPEQLSQIQQISLIDYDNEGIGNFDHLNRQNDVWNSRYEPHSQGQICDIYNNEQQQQHGYDHFGQQSVMHHQPIIQQFNQQTHNQQQDSASQFQFPFSNDYVPSSKLQNIKIQNNQLPTQKKDNNNNQFPEIYKVPLQRNPKKNEIKPQSNVQPKVDLRKLEILKQALLKKKIIAQKEKPKSASIANKAISVPQTQTKIEKSTKDKYIGDKRLIDRPTFIQQQNDPRITGERIKSADTQRNQQFSFGQRKNIQWSQSKTEMKMESGLGKIFPPPSNSSKSPQPKVYKKQEYVPETQKSQKIKIIKNLKCQQISHSRFIKEYCKIPIPPMVRRMNDDLKKIFASIL